MRYALLMHYRDAGEGEIGEEAIAEATEATEALAGLFLLEVPVLDAATGWAEKCPGAPWGVLEVRPVATAFVDGARTR